MIDRYSNWKSSVDHKISSQRKHPFKSTEIGTVHSDGVPYTAGVPAHSSAYLRAEISIGNSLRIDIWQKFVRLQMLQFGLKNFKLFHQKLVHQCPSMSINDPMIPFKGLLLTWDDPINPITKSTWTMLKPPTVSIVMGNNPVLLVEECWYSYHIHLIVTIVIITRHHPWCFLCWWLLLLSWRSSLPGTWTIYCIYIIYNDDITIHYIYTYIYIYIL